MSCNPGAGNYNILSFLDGNAVNITSPQAPANVVILDDVTAVSLAIHGCKGPILKLWQ